VKRESLGPAWLVLIAFVVACVALGAVTLIDSDNAGPAVTGLRAAVTGLATGLVSVVSHYMGRKHDESDRLVCPLCTGKYPDDDSFKAHAIAMHGATEVLEPPPNEVVPDAIA